MNNRSSIAPRGPEAFPHWRFEYIDVDYDPQTQSVWMNYRADAPHHFPLRMFMEIVEVRESLRRLAASPLAERWPFRYFAIASKRPNVFSLGGDLEAFAAAVRTRDRETLRAHASICVDIMAGLISGFDLPIVTVSVVHGQALGGGFEGTLATDFLIADETAKLGLPEIAFNSFPGMGAVTLLDRRVGSALAERLISSGTIYSGREMHELGIVDVVASHGKARETAIAWMLEGGEERWRRRRSLMQARRRCFPVTRDELAEIVSLWVDCVLSLPAQDLRHMDRLVAAQRRLCGTPQQHQVRRAVGAAGKEPAASDLQE